MPDRHESLNAFIEASVWHGPLDHAEAILAAHPNLPDATIHIAAILGNDQAVRRFLAQDPANATAKGGPRHWDALTYLCFSKYLRLDRARSDGFIRAAQALLEAGADAMTGFFDDTHQPEPCFESALYGAAGVAHHAGLTRLLIDHGADPNDREVPYHAPEGYDNEAMQFIVDSGKLSPQSLATMLIRKCDWHDRDGIAWLLQRGADPNHLSRWGFTALHQAIRRDNSLKIIEALLDHGANPSIKNGQDGKTVWSLAAYRGRGDVLALFERRGMAMEFQGLERLIAACARADAVTARSIAALEPHRVEELRTIGGRLLGEFAGNGNEAGVRLLLDLGIQVDSRFEEGDGYFQIAPRCTALHVAAWRARHSTVRLLIARGAAVDAQDGNGRTPLALAIRACVDSHWMEYRSPESVEALLRAGAATDSIVYPTGYAEVDELLRHYGAGAQNE